MLNEVKKLVQAELKSLGINSFYRKASAAAKKPYAVFTVDLLGRDESSSQGEIEVNFWDDAPSTEAIDAVAELVRRRFSGLILQNDAVYINTNFSNLQAVNENSDRKINRRRLVLSAYVYERV